MLTSFRKSLRDFRGFTLVELLVVIAIIGILATLLLLQLGIARAKARDAKRISDIGQLRVAVELYFDDNAGVYPNVSPLTTTEIGKYLTAPALPVDPVTAAAYFYARNPNGVGAKPVQFQLWTELETKNGPALAGDSDINSASGPTPWTGGGDLIDGTLETCTIAYAAGAARDCVYDTGQK